MAEYSFCECTMIFHHFNLTPAGWPRQKIPEFAFRLDGQTATTNHPRGTPSRADSPIQDAHSANSLAIPMEMLVAKVKLKIPLCDKSVATKSSKRLGGCDAEFGERFELVKFDGDHMADVNDMQGVRDLVRVSACSDDALARQYDRLLFRQVKRIVRLQTTGD
jgi:hypothetical protein